MARTFQNSIVLGPNENVLIRCGAFDIEILSDNYCNVVVVKSDPEETESVQLGRISNDGYVTGASE